MKRDDFTLNVKNGLKDRVGGRCSNPQCGRETVGPRVVADKSLIVGEAAHICAATEDGPRYDCNMSTEERKSIFNGIWLCSSCHKLVDSDPERYPVEILRKWKADAEYSQFCRLSMTNVTEENNCINEKQRALQNIKEQFDILHDLLTYAYSLWESNFSRYFNKVELQNEIDDHLYLYKDNLEEIAKYNEHSNQLNMLLKKNSLIVGKEIHDYIYVYLNKICFHFDNDAIGLYNNYWSSFFCMIENNYDDLLNIKEKFDEACFDEYIE